jgi:uncharacterized phage protein gp47/JayE
VTVKDALYHENALKIGLQARLGRLRFRTWDTLSALVAALARRLGEQSAAVEQIQADYFLSSAKGAALDRRGLGNEGVARKVAVPSTGTVTVTRPTGGPAIAVSAGSLTFGTLPDETGLRQSFVTTADLTMATGVTSATVAADATTVGVASNIAAGTLLQITSSSALVTGASAAAAFSGGADGETDDAYRNRLRLLARSRAMATEDALLAAALGVDGVAFARVVDQPTQDPPVVIYAGNSGGLLPTELASDVVAAVDQVRALGIAPSYSAPSPVTFNYTLELVLDSTRAIDVSALREAIGTSLGSYVASLNLGQDRVHRVNRVRDIVMGFKRLGVLDLVDATSLPNANQVLGDTQMAVMGAITWL